MWDSHRIVSHRIASNRIESNRMAKIVNTFRVLKKKERATKWVAERNICENRKMKRKKPTWNNNIWMISKSKPMSNPFELHVFFEIKKFFLVFFSLNFLHFFAVVVTPKNQSLSMFNRPCAWMTATARSYMIHTVWPPYTQLI